MTDKTEGVPTENGERPINDAQNNLCFVPSVMIPLKLTMSQLRTVNAQLMTPKQPQFRTIPYKTDSVPTENSKCPINETNSRFVGPL